jgi:Na+/melibiose symporter-like transporter
MRALFLFMGGQIGIMLLARFFFQWILHYSSSVPQELELQKTALFSGSSVGFALLLFRLFDGASDPIAGSISDAWVRRGGERRKLLLFSLPIAGIGLILCFVSSVDTPVILRWILLLLGMFLFFVGYTFYAIPYWSLIEDYSQGDKDQRRLLSTALGAGLLIATGIGFIITPILVSSFGYSTSAWICAFLGTGLMVLPYFAQPQDMKTSEFIDTSSLSVKQCLKSYLESLKNRRFIALLMLLAGSQMSLTIVTAAAPAVATTLLGGDEGDVSFLMGPLLALAIPSFIFTPWLGRKLGWQSALVIASVFLALAYAATSGLGTAIIGTPLQTGMFLFALGGPAIAILLGLEAEAITDCANSSPDASVGTYFGMFNLFIKALNGLAIFIAGVFIEMSVNGGGAGPIRQLMLVAGGSLLLGVLLYFLIRPRKKLI